MKKEYYKPLNAQKYDNLNEIDPFLERHKLPKLTQGKMNSPISTKEME